MSAQPRTDPGTGVLLDGRYQVEELIARGGMASVHRGHDERLDRRVALKIMHPHLAVDESFRRRFSREARSVARLAHRHVVAVFDQGEDEDRIYLAMELVEGLTLRQRMVRDGQLSIRESLEIVEAVLEALSAAHSAGIVHRDIKPENILLSEDGQVKVADFGLARLIGAANSSATGTLLGTVAYVSPEVVTRGASDERSDLYSLGVVLYEMLVGTQPYTGEAPVHVAFQHVHEDMPAPSVKAPHVPQGVDSLVTWMCSRSPDSRPDRASAALASVRDLLATTPPPVLDAAPLRAGSTSTQDVPRLTAALEDLEDLDMAAEPTPRSFPESLVARARSGLLHDPVPHDAEGTGSPDRDESSQDVSLAARRLPPGRHQGPSGVRRSPVLAGASILAALAVLATGGAASAHWYATTGPGGDRTVPDVAGTDLAAAEAALEDAELETRTREQFSEEIPEGEVISASPSAGTVVTRDTAVTLTVSRGEQTFPVPDTTGRTLDEARTVIDGAGLTLAEGEPQYSEDVPEGQVISQSAAAESLPAGGEVTVVLSRGREPLDVPSQRGKGFDTATIELENAGFTVETTPAYSSSVPRGAVISQNPSSGTLYRGDTVILVVSQGPEMVTVPDVFRTSGAEARATLEAAGFTVAVDHPSGTPVLDLVSAQSAEAGTKLEKGSTVTITVS